MIQAEFKLDLQGLQNLRRSSVRKSVRIALMKSASPVKGAVVGEATRIKRHGFIAKSIRIKVKVYGHSKFVAIIGPGSKFNRAKPGKKPKGKPRRRIYPAHYAHFVERGTRDTRPKQFLIPAL